VGVGSGDKDMERAEGRRGGWASQNGGVLAGGEEEQEPESGYAAAPVDDPHVPSPRLMRCVLIGRLRGGMRRFDFFRVLRRL
jgi:hypothetical protein